MLCPHCQQTLPEGAHYCSQCGKQVDHGKQRGTLSRIGFLLLAFLAVGGAVWYLLSGPKIPLSLPPITPSQQVDSNTDRLLQPPREFMNALKNQNLYQGYEDYTSKGFKVNTSFEKFQNFVKEIPLLTQFSDLQVKAHEINQGRGLVTLLLNPDSDALPVEFRLIQENGSWEILFIRALFPHETKVTGGKLDALSILSTVQEYLELLQNKKIGQAYLKFLSSDLQKEVPLEGFAQFIEGYPAFTSHDSINIKEPYFEDNMGEVTIELGNGEEVTEVTYALKEEKGEWKIVGMHVEKVARPITSIQDNPASFKTRDLIDAIQTFLKALRDQKVDQAYADLTANHFRENNTLPEFEEFLKKYPQLSESESASFEKLLFNNNIATFAVALYVTETEALPVEFDLIQVKGKWKILNLFIHPLTKVDPKVRGKTPELEQNIEFTQVQLGTKIDPNGQIVDPTTSFKVGKNDIYVNIFVHNGKAGTTFTIVMRHVESGSSIPEVRANVIEDGDSVVSLVFSPPPKGWPAGNYQIRIESDNKVYKTFVFKVE